MSMAQIIQAAGRTLRNAFREWAAGMNSGESYDETGRVTGFHSAGYVREDAYGGIHQIPAQDYDVVGAEGRRLDLRPLTPGPG